MFPPYDYTNTIESVRKKFLKRAIADKELMEYKGDVYVDCRKNKGEASYNSCVDYIRDEGNGKYTVVIAVKMSPSDDTFYIDLKKPQESLCIRIIFIGKEVNGLSFLG